MSLDAQDWVWEHSASKGTARLVLLAVADKASGPECTAYAGTTFLVKRSRAARSSVVVAVDRLIESGELKIVDGRTGPRGETCYGLPLAVGHKRRGGPESGPVRKSDPSENKTPRGPESGPDRSENETPSGPESGPHNAVNAEHAAAPDPSSPPQDPQQAAASFLRDLPTPWAVGKVTADALAPLLLQSLAETGWNLNADLAKKLTEKPDGINNHRAILRIRITDLPKRPHVSVVRALPDWCGLCAGGDPNAKNDPSLRWVDTPDGTVPCPKCSLQAHRHTAA